MKRRNIFAALLLIVAGSQTANAQKVTLHLSDNQTLEYNISQLDSITFSSEETDGREIGIVIQGTDNPLNHSFDIPADIQSNILLAYDGIHYMDGKFPTARTYHYVRYEEALSQKDMEMIGTENQFEYMVGFPLFNEYDYDKAYAGKICFSITPSDIDLSGAMLDVVNYQDEVSPFKLASVRWNPDTGLYEADAYVKREDLDKCSINFWEMSVGYVYDEEWGERYDEEAMYAFFGFFNSFGEMVNNFHDNGESDLNRMASEIYQFVRSSDTFQVPFQSLERYRLRLSFTENGQERTIYSQDNLISVVDRPLSIAFGKDFDEEFFEEYPNFLNRFLPFMVTEDANGCKLLSDVKYMPTIMSSNHLKFYPTTNTMELCVPVARKHIAVTNVFKGAASAQDGDADCIAKLKAANNTGDMNKVIDGTQRMIEVDGMQSGYIYEVAYSILDFRGYISTKKYYIRIKE